MMKINKLKIVIDTNVLLVSVSSNSKFHWLYRALLDMDFEVSISNEILTEYEEVFKRYWSTEVADDVLRNLIEQPNVHQAIIYFHLLLITVDPDDDKFVDCAFASGVDYIVTNDTDYNILKKIEFPKIKVVTLQEFEEIFITQMNRKIN